ncbi:MAG: hypothetical protein EWV42_05720 [Microcystis panniformis Mp_GB_SS_20050300_S99D]|nr:MAG: hypothetical protein EWV42_05720 [Microcystis panniformis Mp_GB_SS_20050300_S99D]
MTRRDGERNRWTDEMLDELADSVSEVKDSVSELRESVSEVRESVDGVRITAQALLQIAAQQQRRQEESDKRFEVLLSEVRYLIRQIKPENQS